MSKNAAQKQRAKYTAYLRSVGRPTRVPGQEASDHVRRLHDYWGMPLARIATLAGLAAGTVHDIYHQDRGATYAFREVYRETHQALMAVEPEIPTGRGAYIPPHGTARRLNALALQGFPPRHLADMIGLSVQNTSELVLLKVRFVRASTAWAVRELYQKFDGGDPAELGVTSGTRKLTVTYAKRRGAAPAHCWDEDTIDDPDAMPEWTGRCGSDAGYRLHRTHGLMPPCQPCTHAHSEAVRRAKSRGDRPLPDSGGETC